jgi:inosine-uridine nucleoside N-ribohydrolase
LVYFSISLKIIKEVMKNKIIIDTDPGVDDSMAIQFALSSPELEIIGLTTVFGNVNVELATVNALRLLELAERPEIPVAMGAANPLKGKFSGGVPFVHGEDGQGNTFKPESSLSPLNLSAEDFIIEKVLSFPKELTIVALGPLTNIVKAVQKNPNIVPLIKNIVFMGGNAFCPGNATPSAEANVYGDPHAADILFGLLCPITMVGLDVTHKTILTDDILKQIAQSGSALNKHVSEAYRFYRDFFFRVNKIDGTFVHDSSAIAYVIDSSFFRTHSFPIRVEIANCISKGKTWPSLGDSDHEGSNILLPWANRPKIKICYEVDSEKFVKFLKTRLMK